MQTYIFLRCHVRDNQHALKADVFHVVLQRAYCATHKRQKCAHNAGSQKVEYFSESVVTKEGLCGNTFSNGVEIKKN